jgi:hypothetical protein
MTVCEQPHHFWNRESEINMAHATAAAESLPLNLPCKPMIKSYMLLKNDKYSGEDELIDRSKQAADPFYSSGDKMKKIWMSVILISCFTLAGCRNREDAKSYQYEKLYIEDVNPEALMQIEAAMSDIAFNNGKQSSLDLLQQGSHRGKFNISRHSFKGYSFLIGSFAEFTAGEQLIPPVIAYYSKDDTCLRFINNHRDWKFIRSAYLNPEPYEYSRTLFALNHSVSSVTEKQGNLMIAFHCAFGSGAGQYSSEVYLDIHDGEFVIRSITSAKVGAKLVVKNGSLEKDETYKEDLFVELWGNKIPVETRNHDGRGNLAGNIIGEYEMTLGDSKFVIYSQYYIFDRYSGMVVLKEDTAFRIQGKNIVFAAGWLETNKENPIKKGTLKNSCTLLDIKDNPIALKAGQIITLNKEQKVVGINE